MCPFLSFQLDFEESVNFSLEHWSLMQSDWSIILIIPDPVTVVLFYNYNSAIIVLLTKRKI